MVEDAGLVDLGMEGYQFTWERSRGTEAWVEERLDRVFATTSWWDLFPVAKVWSLEVSCSDDLPIVLDPNPSSSIPRNKRFRFENLWIREAECDDIIQRSWASTIGLPIQQKLAICGVDLLKWGEKFSRDFRKRISEWKHKMSLFRGMRDQERLEGFTKLKK